MKFLPVFLAVFFSMVTLGQSPLQSHHHLIHLENLKLGRENTNEILNEDLQQLWLNENQQTLGFIGKDYQRLRMKLLSAHKNPSKPGQYIIKGKSRVSDNVCEFQGTLEVEKSFFLDSNEWGFERCGLLMGKYQFFEDPDNAHAGIFEGKFVTYWYRDRNDKIIYNNTDLESADYRNNQFAGKWSHYESDLQLTANWGDSRIPQCKDLDVGISEFAVNMKYQKHGWDSFVKAFAGGFSKSITKKAREEERKEWW